MSGIPEAKYRCSKCHYPYPYLLPGGNCPCGGALFDINQTLKKSADLWDDRIFDSFPCVLGHEYQRLYSLSQSNNVYGVFLQLRDVIESTIKFIVLIACAWGKVNNIEGRENAYEKEIAVDKLSLGCWVELSKKYIRPFYENLIGKDEALPGPVWDILMAIPEWADKNKLVNWRNEKLGHGAIGFDDDPEFQQDLSNIIRAITSFYKAHYNSFVSIQLSSNKIVLHGASNARNLKTKEGTCGVVIDNQTFSTEPFIIHSEHGIYFYDELVRKKRSRMLNYQNGHVKMLSNEYTSYLSKLKRDQTAFLAASTDAEFLTRAENDFLTKLGSDDDFVEPTYLTSWIRKSINKHPKGIFLLEMERGCGKTCHTEKLNRRFHLPLEICDDLDVRTYHLGRTQTGGTHEFSQGIMTEWIFGYEKASIATDLGRFAILEEDKDNPENNAQLLAVFLNKLRTFTSGSDARQRKSQILLVLDGLDEINEKNDKIWSYLPSVEYLEEGVYILLTGRISSKEELPKLYVNHINKLNLQEHLIVRADSPENRSFLHEYVKSKKIPFVNDETIIKMLDLADNRVLYLSLLCNQLKTKGAIDFSQNSQEALIKSYLQLVETQYSESQAALFRTVLSILSFVGRFEPLSLKEISDLCNLSSISFALMDIMTDLLPLMRIDRGYKTETGLVSSDNRYSWTNETVLNIVEASISNSKDIFINKIIENLRAEHQPGEQLTEIVQGNQVLLAHYVDFMRLSSAVIKLSRNDLECCNDYRLVNSGNTSDENIIRHRTFDIMKQMILIHQKLPQNDRSETAAVMWIICKQLSEELKDQDRYEDAANILEYQESLIDIFEITQGDAATLYSSMGNVYYKIGHKRAEECFKTALELYEVNIPYDNIFSLLTGGMYFQLAVLYADYQKFEEAKENYEKAIALYEDVAPIYPEVGPKIISMRITMADMFRRIGQGDLAEQILIESKEWYGDPKGIEDLDTLSEMAFADSELAEVLNKKGEREQAYNLNKKAMETYQLILEKGKDVELDLAKVLNNNGNISKYLKKYDEAEHYYLRALQIYEKYAKISPLSYNADVAMTSMNIGNMLYQQIQSRKDEAKAFYQKAYDIYQSLYEANPERYSEEFAKISLNFGQYIHRHCGKLNRALKMNLDALNLFESLYQNNPSDHMITYPRSLYNMATILQHMKSWDDVDAQDFYKQYLRLILIKNHSIELSPKIVLEWARIGFEKEAENAITCPAEAINTLNGWSEKSASEVLRIRATQGIPKANDKIIRLEDEAYPKQSGFKQSAQQKAIMLIKKKYSELLNAISQVKIINGKSSPACKNASNLRAEGKFVDIITAIIDETISNKLLTTGTVKELFLTLAVSGDIQDAFGLVDLPYEKYMSGLIKYDSDTSFISNIRFILYACIESYEGLEIIPYLQALSGMKNYPVTLDDIDTEINTGTYNFIIHETVKHAPEEAKKIIVSTKKIIEASKNDNISTISPALIEIKQDFSKAFEIGKCRIVSSSAITSPRFDDAIDLKRSGKYKEANQIYCEIVSKEKRISTICAVAWFKTLASSGDIQDAMTLAQTVLKSNTAQDQNYINLMTHFYRLAFCMEGVKRHNPIEYLRKISGNSRYNLGLDELDVQYRSGVFKPIIDQCPKDLYRLIVQMLP